jgi:hypothetical protein
MIRLEEAPQAAAAVDGGPMVLDRLAWRTASLGHSLGVVLYWHAEAPLTGRYLQSGLSVFPLRLRAAGHLPL